MEGGRYGDQCGHYSGREQPILFLGGCSSDLEWICFESSRCALAYIPMAHFPHAGIDIRVDVRVYMYMYSTCIHIHAALHSLRAWFAVEEMS
ncbi:hypothetical protein I7I48_11845 [Histoplasma ohiense]|nr:hypothetical protein I7I48_11845 [Histoplasma ohiense (nom. inval.)]